MRAGLQWRLRRRLPESPGCRVYGSWQARRHPKQEIPALRSNSSIQPTTGARSTAEGWLLLGNAYQESGDPARAISAWEHALPLPRADELLAVAERSRGNFPKAIGYWQAAITLEPANSAAHYALGLLLAATSPGTALPELVKAADLEPGLNVPVEKLRTALNTAFLSDDRATQFLVSGQALGAIGEWDLAAEAFRNAASERAGYGEAWAWLGEARQHLGLDGSTAIEQSLVLAPGSAIVQGLYGMYLQRQGKPQAALAAFHKAAALEPKNPGWQMALGSASDQSGDLVAAYEFYFHAVELAPSDASTWRALVTFSVNNDVDVELTGLPAAHKLVSLVPGDWQSYDLAGQAEFLTGNYQAALFFLKKAAQISPHPGCPRPAPGDGLPANRHERLGGCIS